MQALSIILRLPKQFAAIIAAVLVLAAFTIIFFSAKNYEEVLINSVQAENNAITAPFARALRDHFDGSSPHTDATVHLNPEAVASMNNIARQILRNSTLIEIQAIDRSGNIFYSTDSRRIGQSVKGHTGFSNALTGLPHGTLLENETVSLETGYPVVRDLIHSFIPQRARNSDAVIGVIRATTDVTAMLTLFENGQDKVSFFALCVFFGLFLLILLLIRTAEKTLRQQALELDKSRRCANEKNRELEREVAERQGIEERLRKLNGSLEQHVRMRTAELQSAQSELVKQEKLAAMGRLIANVSHELRNPLSTIENSVQLIEAICATKDVDLDRPVARIFRGLQRCRGIIEELLDYTRAREPELVGMDFDSWLKSILGDYILPHGITYEAELSAKNASVQIAPEQFRRVVINLLDNAAQAIAQMRSEDGEADDKELPEGQIRIVSKCTSDSLVLTVADKGPGIAPKDLQRIFEPFFTTKTSGVGLGLPMVHKIIQQHGGRIDVVSTKGQGTEVRVHLPLGKQKVEAA